MRPSGFTLLELVIAMGILSIVTLLMFMATATSTGTVNVADAERAAQQAVRDAMNIITRELELAAREDDTTISPITGGVQGVRVVQNPALPAGRIEIVYQTPLAGNNTTNEFNFPRRIRHINEDLNGNLQLDPGEDTNGNGRLDMRLEILRDGDRETIPITLPDGVFDDNERTVIAGANNLETVNFVVNANGAIDITLVAAARVGGDENLVIRSTLNARVYPMN